MRATYGLRPLFSVPLPPYLHVPSALLSLPLAELGFGRSLSAYLHSPPRCRVHALRMFPLLHLSVGDAVLSHGCH